MHTPVHRPQLGRYGVTDAREVVKFIMINYYG